MDRARLIWMRTRLLIYLSIALSLSACAAETNSGPSASVRVVEAGWSFGFCLGPCRGALRIDGAELTYRVSDRTGDEVFATNGGSLTARGRATLEALAGALPESLLPTYGCPDCADAGAAYVLVERGDETKRSDYEYPNPPPELAALDAFLKATMESLGTCQATGDVTLGPGCQATP
jgi:hypothetical protein